MSRKNIRILGTGSILPSRLVNNDDLEKRLGLESGWIDNNCGVKTRYHVDNEEASEMGKKAALIAIERAGINLKEIDLIIGVSGVVQQAIPSMSALIHKKLGLRGIQAFDVNSTCMSFLSGLSIAADLIEGNNYKNILLVSADIASVGLNPKDPKTASLFGDGAAAAVVGPSGSSSSHIKTMVIETWTEAQEACLFEAGGTKLHLKELPENELYKQYFQMNGPRLFKSIIPHAMRVVSKTLEKAKTKMEDIALCIPHQASPSALNIFSKQLEKRYGLFSTNFLNIVQSFGNMIATSIPHALDYAIQNRLLKRGDQCLLVGTSAGLSVGGVLIEY